jgi:hypothetical protein
MRLGFLSSGEPMASLAVMACLVDDVGDFVVNVKSAGVIFFFLYFAKGSPMKCLKMMRLCF